MTDTHARLARLRLDAALADLAVVFRGAVARPDESNCECHWGSAEELALLKVPGVELDPDLLRRSWYIPGWSDLGAVLRRILPQLAAAVVDGGSESHSYQNEIGVVLFRADWQAWPREQAAAVREFLHAFWAHTLLDPTAYPPQTLVLCVEASGELRPWLDVWEALDHPTADHHLAEAVDSWDYDLLADQFPWRTSHNDSDVTVAVLTDWLTRHAPARLRAFGAPDDLLQRLRLIGLTGPDRWNDPHLPKYTY